jgi:hypothetical protein
MARFFEINIFRIFHPEFPCSIQTREDSILGGPRSFSFWLPRNLSNHMIRQARTGDTVLVNSRETGAESNTGRGEKGSRRQKTKYIGPVDPNGGGEG